MKPDQSRGRRRARAEAQTILSNEKMPLGPPRKRRRANDERGKGCVALALPAGPLTLNHLPPVPTARKADDLLTVTYEGGARTEGGGRESPAIKEPRQNESTARGER